MQKLEGGCQCGAVRYRLESSPILTHACHCRVCQRMSGAAYAVNAMIEASSLTLLATAPIPVHTPSASPEGQIFHRCPVCQVALWSTHSLLGPPIAIVCVGTLDAPSEVDVDIHLHSASKHPSVTLTGGILTFDGDYDSDTVWTEEVKARIYAALAGNADTAP